MNTIHPVGIRHNAPEAALVHHLTRTNRDRSHPDRELWKVSLKFESLLLQQMMSAMRKTVPKSSLLQTGFANDVYNSMFDQVVAEAGSHRSSLGIASSIYRQLDQSHRTQAQAPATDNVVNTTGILNQSSGEKHGAN